MLNFRKRNRPAAKKDDFADGRDWNPLDVSDGRPRLMLTADTAMPDQDGGLPVHVDYWNGVTWENASELLMIGQRVVTSKVAEGGR